MVYLDGIWDIHPRPLSAPYIQLLSSVAVIKKVSQLFIVNLKQLDSDVKCGLDSSEAIGIRGLCGKRCLTQTPNVLSERPVRFGSTEPFQVWSIP